VSFKPRILVVDDEAQIHRFLTPALEAAGFEAAQARDGASALAELARHPPDAVLLDLGLPDLDGQEVLRRARAFFQGPVIVLSARDREAEKIAALDGGADDYVEKPFGVGELLARLRVALRRAGSAAPALGVIRGGDLEVDLALGLVRRAGVRVRLTKKEFELLAVLARAEGKVVTHKRLLTAVWGAAHEHDVQYLRVLVGQIRQKLERDPAAPELLVTEPGVGYRFLGEAE
jgi:two-component system KDP operon response regulator KdpE